MSSKLKHIPIISTYRDIQEEMARDLEYRQRNRLEKTSLGRPLYYHINIQVITTQECPFNCPFCMERQNPMEGNNNFTAQLFALEKVLSEHKGARLSITGGEPGLYPSHVKDLVELYKAKSDNIFVSINTTGISPELRNLAHINLSVNDYVKPDVGKFPDCTLQTVFSDDEMTLDNIKHMMQESPATGFSFRFLSSTNKREYPVEIWNGLAEDQEIEIGTFRIGDFFVYATFNWRGKHGRVTLGDMWQQQHNEYLDGYSNIIIHPDGTIGTNWK